MGQDLKSWLANQTKGTVSVESLTPVIDIDANYFAAFDGVDYNQHLVGLEASLESFALADRLSDLVIRVHHDGGMSRQIALEAFSVLPHLGEKYTANQFTITPTQIGMEAVDGMEVAKYGAIAVGAAALAALIWKIIKWIRGLIAGDEDASSEDLGKALDEKASSVKESISSSVEPAKALEEQVKTYSGQTKSAIKAHLEERYKVKQFSAQEVAVISDSVRFAKYLDSGMNAAARMMNEISASSSDFDTFLQVGAGAHGMSEQQAGVLAQKMKALVDKINNASSIGEIPIKDIKDGISKLYESGTKLQPDWALYPSLIMEKIQPAADLMAQNANKKTIVEIDATEKLILGFLKNTEETFKKIDEVKQQSTETEDKEDWAEFTKHFQDMLKAFRDAIKISSTLIRENAKFLEMLNVINAKCIENASLLGKATLQVAETDTSSEINKEIIKEKTAKVAGFGSKMKKLFGGK